MPRPEVQKADDPVQVRDADRRIKRREKRKRERFARVLATSEGREVLWDRLEKYGVFESVVATAGWPPDPYAVAYQAGRQDAGHQLMADIVEADERAYPLMVQEAQARERSDAVEREAAHTKRAGETGEGEE